MTAAQKMNPRTNHSTMKPSVPKRGETFGLVSRLSILFFILLMGCSRTLQYQFTDLKSLEKYLGVTLPKTVTAVNCLALVDKGGSTVNLQARIIIDKSGFQQLVASLHMIKHTDDYIVLPLNFYRNTSNQASVDLWWDPPSAEAQFSINDRYIQDERSKQAGINILIIWKDGKAYIHKNGRF